jgi:hypothetical protein
LILALAVVFLAIALMPSLLVNVRVLDEVPPIEKRGDLKLIGLVSDTHIPSRSRKLPDRVFEIFKDADMIIHAGDLTQIEVVKELEKFAPVLAVRGNMDSNEVRAQLPEFSSVEVCGWKIGVIHDPGALWGMVEMKRLAKENHLNVLVFGHTHRQFLKWEDGILFINPGSPTDPLLPILVKPTVGLLLVTEEKVEPLIVKV